jgi:hypothetical protein
MWGDVWFCDITSESGNNDVVAVKGYKPPTVSGSGAVAVVEIYSAWGTADGVDFCCDESSTTLSPINEVVVRTGEGNDEIWFTATDANGDEKNLSSNVYQTTSLLRAEAWAGDGSDYVYGSNSTASNYQDYLAGEDGPDLVHGNGGDDYITVANSWDRWMGSTDNHGESVHGDAGRDEIEAGVGDPDTIFVQGGSGADLLCTSARLTLWGVGWITGGNVQLWGDGGNDEIYENAGPGSAIDGGGGSSDGCSNGGSIGGSNCERAYNANNFFRTPITCTM